MVEAVERGMASSKTASQGLDVQIKKLLICEPRLGVFLSAFAASKSLQCLLLTGSTLEHVRRLRLQ